MQIFEDFCIYLSKITTINKDYIILFLSTILVFIIFRIIKLIGKKFIKNNTSGRKEYIFNQTYQVLLNILEILILLSIWDQYIKNIMTLISVVSAAMTISLRELIVNFFSGLYIRIKKPFKVEDRIQVGDIKGDVMNISAFNFEVLEISTQEENGQSTGVVVTFPNSVVFNHPVKNINKGFKYIWNEMKINIKLDSDLVKNKQEIYKIVNNIEIIKNIPKKMEKQISDINTTNRVYFNKYEPIIYTKIVDDHIELSLRYLMHPKKARYVESVIWNKIYLAYKEGKIDLYTS